MRYVTLLRGEGRRGGMLFAKSSTTVPKLCHYGEDFFGVLEDLQSTRADLICSNVDVREQYGILRSLRRGVTGHATNMEVPEKIVNSVNRWRKEMHSDSPSLTMAELYADLKQVKPTVLQYSAAL
jgi:hypothetical protein